jgi:hypothetical protein
MERYKKRYEKLIEFYKNWTPVGYVEVHHILPKCIGGNDEKENLVSMPPRAHYLAHYFLWKCYPDNPKICHAFAMMGVNNPYQKRAMGSKLYECSRLARSHALKGKKRSEETKMKMRKPKSDSHRKKLMGNTNARGNKGKLIGVKKTKEHVKKLVESRKWHDEKRTREKEEKIENKIIKYVPLWKWLLE